MPVRVFEHITRLFLFFASWLFTTAARSQCANPVNSFPYYEGYETSDGSWFAGGINSDWAWGSPSKSLIQSAGEGTRCWITGGLTGNGYKDAQASWLQSPCFDFSALQYPFISFLVYWEIEHRFDGATLQYSTDGGIIWNDLGSSADGKDCLNDNWFNYSPVTYLSPLSSAGHGWSGTIQPTSGICQGGNGSNAWVTAKHVAPQLAGMPSVTFRFAFGSGTTCSNYNGFAVDSFTISEAPPNVASYSYTCIDNKTLAFNNSSALCPTSYAWDFGDPSSGENSSTLANPIHEFSGPGTYSVSLRVSGPGNAPSTITRELTTIEATASVLREADCIMNDGGSAMVTVAGGTGNYTYEWISAPPQSTPVATDLPYGEYIVVVSPAEGCPDTAKVMIPTDPNCTGVYFPSAFTPNGDGLNDYFGPSGSLGLLSGYRLEIFNRWGQRVFSTKNPFLKWDGRTGNESKTSESFAWFAEFEMAGQGRILKKGIIVLIK